MAILPRESSRWRVNLTANRRLPISIGCVAIIAASVGCIGQQKPEEVDTYIWGKRGITEGRLQKPRAVAIDAKDRLYLVDMTARIQVFDVDGKFLRSWRTPASKNGRPSGLSIDRQGRLLVADTHYYQMLVYDTAGVMVESATIGGTQGHEGGNFGFVTDAVEDSKGNFYIAEYGDFDRIQKFSPTGEFLLQWGGHGSELGQFRRPQNLAIDEDDHIWVVDACNHRIQVFDEDGNLLKNWGEEGSEIGKMYYPYDLVLDGQGHLFVCEYGNHRVQKFTLEGESLGVWGSIGKGPGQLHNPWALARDSKGRLHVLDSNNHRVQRFFF